MIVVNQRNKVKESIIFPPDKPVKWISKYGSISFNQFGKELPYGGINEKGLVIEIMVAKANYPKYDERPAVNELQWIQYQLDNSSCIEDIIENDKNIRLSKINQELHFLICDKEGNTAVIEFQDGEMVVYRNESLPIPVLENSTYSKSLNYYKNNVTCRFTTATNMLNKYDEIKKSAVDYSFVILDKVALDGSWSIVYDIKNMKINFKTASNSKIKTIDINSFDFDCNETTYIFDLLSKDSGDISSKFKAFNSNFNKKKMEDAMKLNKIQLPEEILNVFYNYNETIECNKQ
jgi:choloylglycine hydrolase